MKKKYFGILFSLMLALVMMAGMTLTAQALTVSSDSKTWSEDCQITEDVTINDTVTVTADITLTIPEGKTLTIKDGINADGHTLTVEGKGTLRVSCYRGNDGKRGNNAGIRGGNGHNGEDGAAGAPGIAGNLVDKGANIFVTGGKGGYGGDGGYGNYGVYGGNGGKGGDGGAGGAGVNGNITVKSGYVEARGGIGGTGAVGGEGANGEEGGGAGGNGGNGGNGGIGITGDITVESGEAAVSGGNVEYPGAGSWGYGYSGSNGKPGNPGTAVQGTISGSKVRESDDFNNWAVVSGNSSTKKHVNVVSIIDGDVFLNKTSTILTTGDVEELTATIEPANATYKTVTWSVDKENIKLYSDEGCTKEVGTEATETLTVYAKANSAGPATITAASSTENGRNANCEVTVYDPHIHDEITFDPWTGTDTLPSEAGNYYLTQDIHLGMTWLVNKGTINLCLNGHSISGNNAFLIYVNDGATLNLYDEEGSTGSITGSDKNQAAVVINNSGRFNMKGGAIKDSAGCGVAVYKNSTFTMENGEIANNKGSGVKVQGGRFTMSGGSISSNSAKDYGGGIFVGNGASLVLESGTISNNRARNYDGGGVYLDDGAKSFIMNGGVIRDNYASSDGGGVALHDGTFTLNGGTISGNTAGEDGGGIFVTDENAVFVMSDEAVVSSNNAKRGGGVFIDHGSFSLENGSIKENTAKDNGGGVYVSGSVEFNMKAGSIEKNTAKNNGGGVSTISDFTMSGGSISGNSADNWGGGIYTEADINMASGEISNNDAGDYGGGVSFHGDTFAMSGGTIKGNESTDNGSIGGGVFVDSGGKFTMKGSSTIKDNKSDEEGGGVFVYGTLTMDSDDAVISGNETGVRGGGISCDGYGYYVINKGTISNNIAGCEGGGLYVLNRCTMNGGSVTGNKALSTDPGEGGGGVSVSYLSGSVFTMTGGEITGNTAVNQGGGINLERYGESSGTLKLSGNPVITRNKKGEADDNIYLPEGNMITVADALGNGANVGVSMETAGTFTTGYKTNMADADPAGFFASDDKNYRVIKDASGEAKLGKTDITNVAVSIDAPSCGEEIKIRDMKYPAGAQPHITVPNDAHYSVAVMDDGKTLNAYWGDTKSGTFDSFEDGTKLEGGKKYTALVFIEADPGYHIANDLTVTVNGKDNPMYSYTDDHQLRVYWEMTASHELSRTGAKEASCEAGGNIEYWSCSGCGKFFSDADGKTVINEENTKIDALGHAMGEAVRENETAETCTKIGGYDLVRRCTRCNEVIMTTHVVKPSLGHDWGDWVTTKEPGENEDGEKTRTCKNDPAHTETRAIPAEGHVHSMKNVGAVSAKCTENGIKAHWKCTKCGNFYADEAGTKQLTSDDLIIKATGHTAGAAKVETRKEPTCTKAGYHESVVRCTVCSEEISREKIQDEAALGHDLNEAVRENEKAATCTGYGGYDIVRTCKRCDEVVVRTHVVIPKKGHDWGEWEVTTPATKEADGLKTRICRNDSSHIQTEVIPKLDPTPDPTPTPPSPAPDDSDAHARTIQTVEINAKTVNAAVVDAAVRNAGGSSQYVTTIVLGKKVKKISKGAFKNYKNVKTLVVKTKKLKKSKVKKSLKGSKITKVKVKVSSKKKINKKYVKKYKKIFAKKNAGKKVKVTR